MTNEAWQNNVKISFSQPFSNTLSLHLNINNSVEYYGTSPSISENCYSFQVVDGSELNSVL